MVAKKYNIEELKGKTFNRVTITGERKLDGQARQFSYVCVCGGIGFATPYHIVSGTVKSCGCYHAETSADNGRKSSTTHGMYGTRPHRIWTGMKTRCDNPNVVEYPDYGGRGITYCDKWKTFEGFWEDMAEGYSDILTIDRNNTNGNYEKSNCSWETMSVQGHHRRSKKTSKSSFVGVRTKENHFEASFCKNGVVQYLGRYKTEYEAAQAYDDAYELVYGTRNNKTERKECPLLTPQQT